MLHTQLRAFHHVATAGGFSRAADRLGLTQPAISDQVKKLEREHDVLLIRRTTKQIALTDAGARLFEITRRLFDAERSAVDLLTEQRAVRTGTLRIFADSPHHVLPVLARFRTDHPHVSVQVRTGNTVEILEGLRAYAVDIGVIGEVPSDRAFDVIALGASPIVAFARHVGPLDGRSTIPMAELLSLPLVLREEGSKTRAKLEQAASRPVIAAIEAEGREAVREIVAAGGGVGIVSEAEFTADPRLIAVRINEPELTMDEAILCLCERAESKLIRTFMSIARTRWNGLMVREREDPGPDQENCREGS